jgi:alkanesulfonate monooxygenase SsuD/methylene tetrahydromethanopterin reductase-like flavin-dependent oxidoreductase (luciferase family)
VATSWIRIGPGILNNDLLHPVLAAGELATLDVVSSGRRVVGIGAAWQTADHLPAKLWLDRPALRIERLAGAVGILKPFLKGR